jgi:hypothetical protein
MVLFYVIASLPNFKSSGSVGKDGTKTLSLT